MPRVLTVILSIALLSLVSTTKAETELSSAPTAAPVELTSADTSDWSVTNPDATKDDVLRVATADVLPDAEYLEVTTDSSVFASYTNTPLTSGTLEFKAKHNQAGLFYIYAQTSDNGNQLLFSIQFTESDGILLEESDQQITLLPDYIKDEWYTFSIDFDNTRGTRGTFKVTIDGTYIGEYEYVKSESSIFDLAQITIGSESTGETSVSGFADSFSTMLNKTPSTVSDALLLLSISLSSTSISSNLDNGLIVTASLDGIASVATSSAYATATATSEVSLSSSTEEDTGSGLGTFISGIIESVIDLFTPGDTSPTEAAPEEETEVTATTSPEELNEPLPTEPESVPAEVTPEPEPEPEQSAVESSLSADETSHDITTTTF